MPKQERVPETRDETQAKPNRQQRRHPDEELQQQPRPENEPLTRAVTDEPDPRTKGSGHRKKTADKWNQ